MATPYTINLIFKSADGSRVKSEMATFSDVDLARATFQSTGLQTFSMPGNGYLYEMSRQGTVADTKYLKLFINGSDTGQKVIQSDLLSSRNPPHLISPGFYIAGGSMVQIQETAV